MSPQVRPNGHATGTKLRQFMGEPESSLIVGSLTCGKAVRLVAAQHQRFVVVAVLALLILRRRADVACELSRSKIGFGR